MSETATLSVTLPTGVVVGNVTGQVVDFAGVRYADRSGPGRFSEAGPARIAQSEPAAFPQRSGALDVLLGPALAELPQDEEAFLLRIQTPISGAESEAGAARIRSGSLPVLVVVPGGGFLSGAAHARWFAGSPLIADGPLVLVTVNYRVGVFGHIGPSGEPGEANRGLRDLKRALHWIRANIAAFGGDPDRITLMGDSAGAWYVHALAGDSSMEDYFSRTVLISYPYEPPLDAAGYAARRAALLEGLHGDGKSLDSERVECLLDAQSVLARAFAGRGMPLMPAVNPGEIPADLGNARTHMNRIHVDKIALLTASEEAAAFLFQVPEGAFSHQAVDAYLVKHFEDPATTTRLLEERRPAATPKQRMIDAITLYQFRSAALEIAEAFTDAGGDAWVAEFDVQSRLPGAYAPHCFPLPFLFGTWDGWSDAPMLAEFDRAEFDAVSAVLREWLIAFVRDGAPAVAGVPLPRFDSHAPQSLEVGAGGARLVAPREWGVAARRSRSADESPTP